MFVAGVAAYISLLAAAFVTGSALLAELAVFAPISVLLLPGLRRGRVRAWAVWAVLAMVLAWLAWRGHGEIALDGLPVIVNAALCALFARTLMAHREPLIARLIGILEGPSRLALPGVASYARRLTWAWALLLGTQACVLLVLVVFAVPNGLLDTFGLAPPFAIPPASRWYVRLGGYALPVGFMLLEYVYRRWHLRHLTHMPLSVFIARLARRWPMLAVSSIIEMQGSGR